MASLDEFARSMRRRGRTVEVNSSRAVRQVALMVLQTLAVGTPVDTGRARSNWLVSINNPIDLTIGAHAPGEAGSTGGQNSRIAIQRGSAVIATYAPGNHSIYISNNLPYIERLNQGWSAQAPAGFVEAAVAVAREAARRQNLLQ